MAGNSTLDARRDRLGAAIAAAQAKLAARRNMDDDGIGEVLAGLNDDLDQIVDADHDAALRACDRIEARLAAERIRIEDDAEDQDG